MGLNVFCLVLRKLPPKMKNHNKFTIPCLIGESYIDKCLCHLGPSINLMMPYFVFKKLGITNLEPTNITLYLANHSVVYPRKAIEDVLVKVDKFIFRVDFVIVDIKADEDAHVILG